jgi:hypothetical protein
MRRRIHAHEEEDTCTRRVLSAQGSRKSRERAREREEREVLFYLFIVISHCSSVMQRGQKTPSSSDQILG